MIHFLLAINFSMHDSPSLFLCNIIFGDSNNNNNNNNNPISASREKLRQRIIIIIIVVFSEVSMGTTSL